MNVLMTKYISRDTSCQRLDVWNHFTVCYNYNPDTSSSTI